MKVSTMNSNHIVSHQVLLSLLKGYRRPNDKISEMMKQGELISLKKGYYIFNQEVKPERFSIANALYGPSYISMESALSFYGMIPEQVFSISSATLKASKTFENRIGRFEYINLPPFYYALETQFVELREEQFCLIATPEKALCDKIITEKKLQLRSMKSAQEYLIENLRIDEYLLRELKVSKLEKMLSFAPKKSTLEQLIMVIKTI